MNSNSETKEQKAIVGIIMGSDSDWPVMRDAAEICKQFGVPAETRVVSAHRTPDLMAEYAKEASGRGIRVIIAGAGGAAHLPGMVASYTTLPVIGVPVQTKSLKGIDSLLSIVQMPKGIPVATVAINNAANAGLLAIRILAATNSEQDQSLSLKIRDYHTQMALESQQKNENLI
ncbi:MAG: 5-(carboxyamino)imidazole ribonucleotide mutase [Balneolales bacterium]|nr:5-(carboxyamino)imidazole ribonucleotide mutase [Balneolales bacterium]